MFFRLKKDKEIEVGALGGIEFSEGLYMYVGSGGRNVLKRVERHFTRDKTDHWHIDYLSKDAEPVDYFILPETSDYECVLSDIAESIGDPVQGFGCSDCGCESHLFKVC